jgi:hypothetical protein
LLLRFPQPFIGQSGSIGGRRIFRSALILHLPGNSRLCSFHLKHPSVHIPQVSLLLNNLLFELPESKM